MLFGFWQLKTTVYVLFLASCLGQEYYRACDRDYCYERAVEVRTTDPNDLREWYLYRGENLERGFIKAENRRYGNNQQINEIDERRVDLDLGQNLLLREENRQENTVLNDRRDVTRHLDDKSDEHREALRRFEEPEFNRHTDDIREQPQTLRHSDESSENKRERLERYDTIRRFDTVRRDMRLENKRKDYRENTRERMENRKNLRLTSERDINQEERCQKSRQLDKPEVQRDDMRRLENTRQSRRIGDQRTEINRESRQRRDENKREQLERDETIRRLYDRKYQREINRRSESNHDEREVRGQRDTTRRLFDTQRERELIQRTDENKRERVERDETLRKLKDRQGQHEIRRYSEDNRKEHHDTIRQLDEPEVQSNFSRRSDGTRANKGVYERLSQRERENRRHRHENKRERVEEREAQIDVSRRSENEIRHETLRQANKLESRRAINIRHSERERETTQRHDENEPERDHQAQREINRRLEDNREEHRETLRQLIDRDTQRVDEQLSPKQQSSRRFEEKRKEHHETLKQFNEGDVRKSLDATRDSQRIDERLSRREQDTRQHRKENQREERDQTYWRHADQQFNELEDRLAENKLTKDTRVSQHIDRRLQQRERESTQRRDQNKVERAERVENLRSQLEINRWVEDNRETIRQLIDRDTQRVDKRLSRRKQQRLDKNKLERDAALNRLEDRQVKCEISKRSEDSLHSCHETLRQLGEQDVSRRSVDNRATQRIAERLNQRERKLTQHLDENNRKYVVRVDDPEVQRYDNICSSGMESIRRVRVERDETLRSLEDRQAQREIGRLPEDNREESQREQEYRQRSDKHNRVRVELYQREREATQLRDENKREQVELPESLRRVYVRETQRRQNIRLVGNFERYENIRQFDARDVKQHDDKQRDDKLLFQREKKSIQRSNGNIRERIERHESLRRHSDRETHMSLENKREELRSLTERDDRLLQREYESRKHRNEKKRERVERYQVQHDATRLLENRKINRRSDDSREDEILFRRKRESVDRNDETRRERVERHETLRRNDECEAQRDATTRLINTRDKQKTTENRNDKESEERYETSRKFKEQSINRILDDNQQFRHLQTERTFIVKQKYANDNRSNHHYIEDDYAVKPTAFLKKGSLFLGQGVILAFVIMKTIIGKDDLKHQIPQNIREAVGKMGF